MTEPVEFLDGRVRLFPGDCRASLALLADSSIDSVVTDPPYALNFMGKQWDTGDVAFLVEFWAEVFRVLKPGGHVAAFGASRGYHRLACAIEDAGFEIRDSLMWLYGTGFPKSHDVGKGIDKHFGAKREVTGTEKVRDIRNGHGRGQGDGIHAANRDGPEYIQRELTAAATPEAEQWDGWGTALKPAFEPIVLARKPLSEKTVAANVLRWGTGALNIDGCRVGTEGGTSRSEQTAYPTTADGREDRSQHWARTGHSIVELEKGRWPANVVHDGSDEVVEAFPETNPAKRGVRAPNGSMGYHGGASGLPGVVSGHADDGGSAARFFYCAKAGKADRAGSKHPTVKPIKLMQWLCRLITPAGGTVLDPFAGSGTTGAASIAEGFRVVLCEREAEYIADIERRHTAVPIQQAMSL